MQDSIEYEALVQNALRNVIRDILADIAKSGQLPGEHHFYISFATQAPGVRISERLKARFPESMTIVLQHRFWDMKVAAEYFTVRLSFGGVFERLTIPFAAMRGFYDPSSAFEIAFTANAGRAAAASETEAAEGVVAFPPQNREADKKQPSHDGVSLPHLPPAFSKVLSGLHSGAENGQSAPPAAAEKSEPPRPQLVKNSGEAQEKDKNSDTEKDRSASVVSLDAFRKK